MADIPEQTDDLLTSQNNQADLAAYDSDKIRTLDPVEHIRMRPGMYIGCLGNGDHYEDGIYVLLKEVVDNCIDEFVMGAGRKVEITITPEGLVTVRDYGRGIPLNRVRDCVSKINTGGKFLTGEDGVGRAFSSSIGQNGVGVKAVNFLSSLFVVKSWRDNKMAIVRFQEGILESEEIVDCPEPVPNGTEITFQPSRHIFPEYHFDPEYVRRRMQHYAWLNNGLSIVCNGEKFYSRRGLVDLLESKIKEGTRLYPIVHYKSDSLEFAFCHSTENFSESYFSFVNTQFTSDGGLHLSAFKEGVASALKEMLAPKAVESDDIRAGIVGAIAIKMQDPVFESQTKNKLGSLPNRSELVAEIKQAILSILYKTPETKDALFEKIEKNENIRRQIQAVKKGAKALEKKNSIRIDKLWDCRYHYNEAGNKRKPEEKRKCEESALFLTEGRSAAGSVVKARDAECQAVYCLTGKPLNCFGMTRDEIYKNEVFYGIMRTIGLEDNNLDNLRYGRIVIATDADVDGFHIRNLLITYFLTFFQFLVESDHVFILETPLFRVRNKTVTKYCYTEEERLATEKALGKGVEITRFKGLGEISPEEFGQFIGEDIKLRPLKIDSPTQIDGTLRYYMGKNFPARRTYILDNLV